MFTVRNLSNGSILDRTITQADAENKAIRWQSQLRALKATIVVVDERTGEVVWGL